MNSVISTIIIVLILAGLYALVNNVYWEYDKKDINIDEVICIDENAHYNFGEDINEGKFAGWYNDRRHNDVKNKVNTYTIFSCREYKSSNCKISCDNNTPYCSCNAKIIDILFN